MIVHKASAVIQIQLNDMILIITLRCSHLRFRHETSHRRHPCSSQLVLVSFLLIPKSQVVGLTLPFLSYCLEQRHLQCPSSKIADVWLSFHCSRPRFSHGVMRRLGIESQNHLHQIGQVPRVRNAITPMSASSNVRSPELNKTVVVALLTPRLMLAICNCRDV
jgi:hypothetical protein